MTTETKPSGREQHSETVQMKLELRDLEAVVWTTGVPGTGSELVKLSSDAGMVDVIQLHKIAEEFDRTVSLYREEEQTGCLVWELEVQ